MHCMKQFAGICSKDGWYAVQGYKQLSCYRIPTSVKKHVTLTPVQDKKLQVSAIEK